MSHEPDPPSRSYDPPVLTARFDDLRNGTAWKFPAPVRILRADLPDQVGDVLTEIETATAAGGWAYGFVAYEAASGLDPTWTVHPTPAATPLAWFAITDPPEIGPTELPGQAPGAEPAHDLAPWSWEWSADDHAGRVAALQEAIAAGDTYQGNLTTQLHSRLRGDAASWYRELAHRQRGAFHALLDIGSHTIVSASPECFLQWQGERLTVVPMKGTARRHHDPVADADSRTALLASAKERAENVMIVDLIRNDLSRLAEPGTVNVDQLLRCEGYATVWQLTSTVTATLPPGTSVKQVFTALFPCGSITGAPKASTMELLAELEDGPRGVYCGAIGWVAPPSEPVRARFGVAIRTGVVDNANGAVSYGVGGGITWDSRPTDEYAELRAKAAILGPPPSLIETFSVRSGVAVNLERHLARLRRSAARLAIPYDEEVIVGQLDDLTDTEDRIVRLELAPDGTVSRTDRPLGQHSAPVRLALDEPTVDPADVLYRHKTTRRHPYDQARARHPGADDVIMVNTVGNVTETSIATLVVRLGGVWCTPPVSDGCLPGIGREVLLEQGILVERSVPAALVTATSELAVVSSVRGWRPAVLVDSADRGAATAGG